MLLASHINDSLRITHGARIPQEHLSCRYLFIYIVTPVSNATRT